VPHNLIDSARTIATIIGHVQDGGFGAVEVTKEAEEAWLELLHSGPGGTLGGPDCTPGYYNNEGQELGADRWLPRGYPYGASAYFTYIASWRRTGAFEGLEFSRS